MLKWSVPLVPLVDLGVVPVADPWIGDIGAKLKEVQTFESVW